MIAAVERFESLRRLCRLALLAGLLALMAPTAGRAVPTSASPGACEPFCGVTRFMKPPPRVAVQHAYRVRPPSILAAQRTSVHVTMAASIRPRTAHAAARPPYGYAAIRPRYYVVVYPGYGYAYYYYYPYPYANGGY